MPRAKLNAEKIGEPTLCRSLCRLFSQGNHEFSTSICQFTIVYPRVCGFPAIVSIDRPLWTLPGEGRTSRAGCRLVCDQSFESRAGDHYRGWAPWTLGTGLIAALNTVCRAAFDVDAQRDLGGLPRNYCNYMLFMFNYCYIMCYTYRNLFGG